MSLNCYAGAPLDDTVSDARDVDDDTQWTFAGDDALSDAFGELPRYQGDAPRRTGVWNASDEDPVGTSVEAYEEWCSRELGYTLHEAHDPEEVAGLLVAVQTWLSEHECDEEGYFDTHEGAEPVSLGEVRGFEAWLRVCVEGKCWIYPQEA